MNKKRVDELLPIAIEALEASTIAKNGSIIKTYRGAISSFGSAITMGSFKAAIAFLAKDADGDVDKSKLLQAVDYICNYSQSKEIRDAKKIAKEIIQEKDVGALNIKKDLYIDASIALKLAMNMYDLR